MHTASKRKYTELRAVLWSFRGEFLIVGLFSMVANVLMLTPTLDMLQVYDRVMISGSELTLLAVSLLALFLLATMAFSEWARSRLLVRLGVRLDTELAPRVFEASFESSLGQTRHSGTKAFSDLIQLRQFITGNGIFAFFDAPWAPVYIAVMFVLHPWLGILSLVFALIQAALGWFGHRHMIEPTAIASEAQTNATSYLQSKFRNAEVIEPMGMQHNLYAHWEKKHADAMEKASRSHSMSHRIAAWSKFIRYSQQSLALGAGALLVIDGQLSPGGMIASNVLMSRALSPIEQIVSSWRSFAGVREAFTRLEDLLAAFPARKSTEQPADAPRGELLLVGVSAQAPERSDPILQNLSVQFPRGSVTAVLGPSGSGKTTLARVLVGIWPDATGKVLLDGMPMSAWDRNALGPQIGYLPQDIELFDGTIADNIARFGELDSEKIIAAARCTGLHEMILRMPKGYDTVIGDAGNILSGGQQQRIALARAVYGEPALVVLDEPNANLDDAGETALAQAIQSLKEQGKTIVLITHRPGALAVADRLLVLRNGTVHAQGPRDDVLATLRSAAEHTPARRVPAGTPLAAVQV